MGVNEAFAAKRDGEMKLARAHTAHDDVAGHVFTSGRDKSTIGRGTVGIGKRPIAKAVAIGQRAGIARRVKGNGEDADAIQPGFPVPAVQAKG